MDTKIKTAAELTADDFIVFAGIVYAISHITVVRDVPVEIDFYDYNEEDSALQKMIVGHQIKFETITEEQM